MSEQHQPNHFEATLVKIFPFLAGLMGISTTQLRRMDENWPDKAENVAHNQNAVQRSADQAKKAKLS